MSNVRVVGFVVASMLASFALTGCAGTTQSTALEAPRGVAIYVPQHATAVPAVRADTHLDEPYVAMRRSPVRTVSKHVGVKNGI